MNKSIVDDEIYSMANGDHTLILYGVNVAPTITSRCGTGGNQVPVFLEQEHIEDVVNKERTVVQSAYSFDSKYSNSMKSDNPNSGCREVDVSRTVDTSDPNPSKNQGGIAIIDSYSVAQNQRGEIRVDNDTAYALTATEGARPGQNKPCVVQGINYQGNKGSTKQDEYNGFDEYNFADTGNKSKTLQNRDYKGGNCVYSIGHDERSAQFKPNVADTLMASEYKEPTRIVEPDIVGTLAAADAKGKNGQDINKFPIVESRIRRLTPVECERLQGLPDDYTNVSMVDKKGKEKPASDANRYKAIGNGMAQPCANFVLEQLAKYTNEE